MELFTEIFGQEKERMLEHLKIDTTFEVNIHLNKVNLPKINSQGKFEQELMKIIFNIPVKDRQVFVSLKLVDGIIY